MAELFQVRRPCPTCGKPMKAVADEAREERLRYVCTRCDDDPLHDPAALKWADSPLRPPRNERPWGSFAFKQTGRLLPMQVAT